MRALARRPALAPLGLAVLLLLAAGLLAQGAPSASDDASLVRFGAPLLIDDVRAGGEPVIAALPGAIVVSAHPGFTHLYVREPSTHVPTEAVQDYAGESYLWRSTDGGASWTSIGLPVVNVGPRAPAPGISDPDMTVTGTGRIVHTDLFAAGASVSWSDDGGVTWLGNPDVTTFPVDRNWVASHGSTLYFTANYLTPPTSGHRVLKSEDGGLTWTMLGNSGCGGDFLVAPDGTMYVGCGSRVSRSTDGGSTFTRGLGPVGHSGGGLNEPAVDGAGNVWVTWTEGSSTRVFVAGSPDKGATWPWVFDLTPQVRAALGDPASTTMVWPWVSAGSAGRVAVTLYASPTAGSPSSGPTDRPWSVVSAALFGADGSAPSIAAQVVKANHHLGPICLSGTSCLLGSVRGDSSSDRRMGDFFETTIGLDGSLLIAYSDTTAHPDDVISHPAFVRQVGGPRFVVDGFVPVQG